VFSITSAPRVNHSICLLKPAQSSEPARTHFNPPAPSSVPRRRIPSPIFSLTSENETMETNETNETLFFRSYFQWLRGPKSRIPAKLSKKCGKMPHSQGFVTPRLTRFPAAGIWGACGVESLVTDRSAFFNSPWGRLPSLVRGWPSRDLAKYPGLTSTLLPNACNRTVQAVGSATTNLA